jgi:hypothetical protein
MKLNQGSGIVSSILVDLRHKKRIKISFLKGGCVVKNTVLSFALSLLFTCTALAQVLPPPQGPSGHVRYRIQVAGGSPQLVIDVAHSLGMQGYDVSGVDIVKGEVEVVTGPSGITQLQQSGFVGYLAGVNNALDPRYMNPERLLERLQALANQNPQMTRLERIGQTNQGRPVWGLLVSSQPQGGAGSAPRPRMIIDGLHHAREVMTPEVVVGLAEMMIQGAYFSPFLQKVVSRWDIWFVPMVNPDGSNIVFTKDNMWRKNARSDSFDSGPYGVDINRNYGYKWRACNGSSTSKWSDIYSGASPSSEPETQALIRLADRERPSIYLSYHSFSEFILYPFGCPEKFPAEKLMFESLAKELSAQLPRDGGRGVYAVGTPWQLLYNVDGDSMSHMHGMYGALAFTFEINREFQPEYIERIATIEKHRRAFLHLLNRADNHLVSLRVVDKQTGQPLNARVAIDSVVHRNDEMPFRTNSFGFFHKVMMPGLYRVTVQTEDGRSAIQAVQMQGEPVSVEVQL